jgi:DNA-binding NtrC family response regulator
MNAPDDTKLAKATVLFVDDEENILKSIQRGLFEEPYKKKYAGSGAEALDIIEREPVSVLVTDMRMPEMDGLTLIKIVAEKNPRIVRIILTGYSQISTLISAINSGQIFRYLTKPWKAESEFIPAVRQAIEYHQMQQERDEILQKLKTSNLELNKRNIDLALQIRQNEQLLTRQKELMTGNEEILSMMTREILPFLDLVRHLGNPEFPLNSGDRERMVLEAVNIKGVIETISALLGSEA